MGKCNFTKAWIGTCNNKTFIHSFCPEHRGIKCVICGEQAVKECHHTYTQFVCGQPLCGKQECMDKHVNKTHST
jgi:hypothetical protein